MQHPTPTLIPNSCSLLIVNCSLKTDSSFPI